MLTLPLTLLVRLTCPPTAIPDPHHDEAHFLASPYGSPHREEVEVAPRRTPEADDLPLWDLDATRVIVEAALASDRSDSSAPEWARWVAWALDRAQGQDSAGAHLVAALAEPCVTAKQPAARELGRDGGDQPRGRMCPSRIALVARRRPCYDRG